MFSAFVFASAEDFAATDQELAETPMAFRKFRFDIFILSLLHIADESYSPPDAKTLHAPNVALYPGAERPVPILFKLKPAYGLAEIDRELNDSGQPENQFPSAGLVAVLQKRGGETTEQRSPPGAQQFSVLQPSGAVAM